MGALAEQHQRWAEARRRLWNSSPAELERVRHLPASPTSREPQRQLFTRAIEELDDRGNVVVAGLFTPRWKQIALDSAEKYGVTFTDVVSARRDKAVVLARHEAFWRCRNETTLSLPQIGKRFGGRDHTTVLHGIWKYTQRMAEGTDG